MSGGFGYRAASGTRTFVTIEIVGFSYATASTDDLQRQLDDLRRKLSPPIAFPPELRPQRLRRTNPWAGARELAAAHVAHRDLKPGNVLQRTPKARRPHARGQGAR